ncbi:MAG: DNA-binding response regulator [Acidobacteria bacterium]|nr:DNA-binding response regulator [Acidobacteriota bacterium]
MSQRMPTRVLLADDHTMVREALARILDETSDIEVVAQARDGREVSDAIQRSSPDVLVLDFTMPYLDPPRDIERLLGQYPSLKILVLTVHERAHYALRALESGAHGYLIKSAASEELMEAIREVRAGRIYLSSSISQDVLARLRTPRDKRSGLEALSPREFSCLRLLGAGKTLQECAREMHVSVSTASTYRGRIMEKLGLDSTAELIRFALEHDLST